MPKINHFKTILTIYHTVSDVSKKLLSFNNILMARINSLI